MAYIKVIQEKEAESPLREIYDHLTTTRGKLAEVHKIQSLNPESIKAHMDLYMTIMFGNSPLRRETREMLAVVVSSANNCPYCQCHHGEALAHFWKDEEKLNKFYEHYSNVDLSESDRLLCELAEKLTVEPYSLSENDVEAIRIKGGFTDRQILDATLVISYFNFVNRMVLGLGVEIEPEGCAGYDYQ